MDFLNHCCVTLYPFFHTYWRSVHCFNFPGLTDELVWLLKLKLKFQAPQKHWDLSKEVMQSLALENNTQKQALNKKSSLNVKFLVSQCHTNKHWLTQNLFYFLWYLMPINFCGYYQTGDETDGDLWIVRRAWTCPYSIMSRIKKSHKNMRQLVLNEW